MGNRPTWVEISRHRLVANYRYLRRLAADAADLLVVVKADAYGHGLEHCAPLLTAQGAEWLGITSVDEGIRTRSLCSATQSTATRILVISGLWHGEAAAAIAHNLTPVVWERFHIEELEAAAAASGHGPQTIAVHLEIDTGMSRQGVAAPHPGREAGAEAAELRALLARFHPRSPLRLEGIMTHFSAPEELGSSLGSSQETAHQMARLAAALEVVAAAGLEFRWLHAGASATLLGGVDLAALSKLAQKYGARLMLRPGLALYGYAPRFAPTGTPADEAARHLQPVLTWKTRVVATHVIPAGDRVSYNGTFEAQRPTRLALIAVGYADGLNRLLSNRASLLVRGRRAPIAGRICMDQCLLDVTDIPSVEIGDEVVVLGGRELDASAYSALPDAYPMDAFEHADLAGTIPWEILCDVGFRVPRLLVN